ncbi:MAG: YceI family protein [Gammaproteobacteria bacterium]|nr:YceI family protein [Gammaproteobacteria bacterium]
MLDVMRTIILLLLLNISLPAFALESESKNGRICAPFRGGVVDPVIINSMLQAAKEGNLYRIQEKHSKVGFCVDSCIGRLEAEFKGIQGGLALRRKVWGDESQMLVMIDTNSLEMKENFVKHMLKSESFLDTETYPRILFVSTQLRWLDHEKAVLEGNLTMHGVTKPVSFDVKIARLPNKDAEHVADIVVTASSFIKRTDFGMHHLTFLVDDTVELCMRVEASLFKK